MKILAVHNYYQQPGGEDQVFANETRLLEEAGHQVIRFTETNDRVPEFGAARLAAMTVWNRQAYLRLYKLAQAERPDVVHFHNTFPLLSPACYYAAGRAGAAVVQTLHNFRLICPAATLLRNGRPCEDCVGRLPWPGVLHACYRGSRGASAAIATMLSVHRAAGTYRRSVDAYIALTGFARSRFIAGGLPPARLFQKPNFLEPDSGVGTGGDALLFAGRLSPEKGLDILIGAWQSEPRLPPLRIIGDGPLASSVEKQITGLPHVEWLGARPRDQVLRYMRESLALVMPSVWFEGFPNVVLEAYASGLPIVASNIGSLAEIVQNATTGLTFPAGDSRALAQTVLALASHPDLRSFRQAARWEYERYYRGERNLDLLLEIYRAAIAHRTHARRHRL